MGPFAELEQRIDRLSARAGARWDRGLREEIDATLSEGYARALAAEARVKRLDRRLEGLLEELDAGDAAELRAVARERWQLARQVARLRARLADMHEVWVTLARAGSA